jgi:hypothetical protein
MKKLFFAAIAAATLAMAGNADYCANNGYITRTGIAYGNEIATEDGNIWSVGDMYYPEDMEVVVTFDGQRTATPVDDVIINVRRKWL